MDIPSAIITLKKKLSDATPTFFQDVMDFFYENLANNRKFLALGETTTNPDIDRALNDLAQSLGKDDSMDDAPVIQVSDYSFIHAPFKLGGEPGTVIYFTDINKGLIDFPGAGTASDYRPFTGSGAGPGNAGARRSAYSALLGKVNKGSKT